MVPKARRITILCVDDEPGALLVRKTVLESAGYAVLAAASADEALSIFASNSVDLVISDHLLPGASGSELANRIKASRPDLPVMLLSGAMDRPSDARIDEFITNGEGPESLLKHVAELLRYRRQHIVQGEYEALIACDTQQTPAVWHCVIQRGALDIVTWSQEKSEKAAVSAAKQHLAALNKKQTLAEDDRH